MMERRSHYLNLKLENTFSSLCIIYPPFESLLHRVIYSYTDNVSKGPSWPWSYDLQLSVQSLPITIYVVSLNTARGSCGSMS